MSARTKLNLAAVNGTLLIAAMAGIVCESGAVFWLVAFLLLAGDLYTGMIRPARKQHDQFRR